MFLRIAEGKSQREGGKTRRFAIVALPGGLVTWAELCSAEAGLLELAAPRATMAEEELQLLEANIPALLHRHSSFAGVNSIFATLKDVHGQPLLRMPAAVAATGLSSSSVLGARLAAAAGTSAAALASPSATSTAASEASTPAARAAKRAAAGKKACNLPYDLKGVSQTELRKFPRAELDVASAERGIAMDPAGDNELLVQHLIAFRDREGRERRARGREGHSDGIATEPEPEAAATCPAAAAAAPGAAAVAEAQARATAEAKAREAAEMRAREAEAQRVKLQAQLEEAER